MCGRMHGHSFQVVLFLGKKFNPNENTLDYEKLVRVWSPIEEVLNYNCLNTIDGLSNPTSEMLSKWIWDRVIKQLPSLLCVSVYETSSYGAHFNGEEFKIWKDFSFDSAIKIENTYPKYSRLHGHTFILGLNLVSPIDDVMGWTKDFGDVKEIFKPIMKMLDHQPLHETLELRRTDTLSIAQWILKNTEKLLPEINGIELYETRDCGVILKRESIGLVVPLLQ